MKRSTKLINSVRPCLAIILGLVAALTYGQDTVYSKHVVIGDTKVSVHTSCFNNCNVPVSFINLHDDEDTSIEAAESFLEENGGKLVQLKHINGRIISFKVKNLQYKFDPNRVFSAYGIQRNLKAFGRYSPAAEKIVSDFAASLVNNFVKGKRLLVGLHNNSDSLYSIFSYTGKGKERRNALRVYINNEMDPDDFVYTTDNGIFNFLKAKKINVVLQNNKTVKDDGSLSVYAAKHKIKYINIEAQSGHLDEQVRMLEALHDIIYTGKS